MSDLGYRWSADFTHGFLKRFTRVEIEGVGHVPREGPGMVCGNHISHFDPYFIGPPVPRPVDFMAMEEFFHLPVIRSWLRWANVYPVHRRTDPAATREAIKRLKNGRFLGIFPERGLRAGATSMLGGGALPNGTLLLAHRMQAPVVPCVILGSDKLYAWKNWLRSISVWIRYGEPLHTSARETPDEFQTRYEEAMRSIYRGMIRDYSLAEEDLPQNPQRRKGRPDPSR